MSEIELEGARHRLPAWIWFTLGGVLAPVSFIAMIFAVDQVGDGGGGLAYAPSLVLAGLACTLIVLGFQRLPRGGGVPGRWAAVFLLVGGLTVVAAVSGVISGIDQETGDLRFAPWLIVALILSGAAGTVWIWRGMDEAAREAHKSAWYWGATVGIVLAMPLFLFEGESERLRAGLSLADSFEQGALSLLLLQSICYGLAWGFWWLRRR